MLKRIWPGILGGIPFLIFVGYNIKTNVKFWEASAVNCITIGIAIVFSYYFAQRQNDRRKRKDVILNLISKIQALVGQDDMYDFSAQEKNQIIMRNRDLNNRIHILESIKKDFSISGEVSFIREKFDEYNTFIGEHIEDMNYLRQSKQTLKRPIELIDIKLTEMALKLYQ